jgi:hypothetical protein
VLIAGDMCSDIEIPLPGFDPADLELAGLDQAGLDQAGLDLVSPNAAGPAAADPFVRYREGLGLLASIAGVRTVVPGHGRCGDDVEFRRRIAADHAYLDAVEAGADIADDRLTEDWLRAEHARALAFARAAR